MTRTPTPLFELFSTLKGYINQLSAGERTPSEVGSALNDWARESAESIKAKINEEVESSVAKMGFIKRDEFDLLSARLEKAEAELLQLHKKPLSRSTAKKTIGKVLKKSASPKKSTSPKKVKVEK